MVVGIVEVNGNKQLKKEKKLGKALQKLRNIAAPAISFVSSTPTKIATSKLDAANSGAFFFQSSAYHLTCKEGCVVRNGEGL
jgi:hypothetical protein